MSDLEPIETRKVTVIEEPVVETQVYTTDNAASLRANLYSLSALIGLLFGILEGLIGIRILLKLIAANPANDFARFVYDVTSIFLAPFIGLTATPAAGGMVLEIPSIIAMVVYALVAWAIIQLFWLLFYHPSAHTVTRVEREETRRLRY